MADRYWVGGTAAWDGTVGTKWATTSGGAGGASVPTFADAVFFNAASGAVTCTISTGNTGAQSINCAGFTGTLAGTAGITISGSITLVAGMTFSYTGMVTVGGTGTITSAGKSFSTLNFNSTGATYTLGDALTVTNLTQLVRGTIALNGFTLSTNRFDGDTTSTRAIAFGSANIALTSTTAAAIILLMPTATGFTYTGTGGFTRVQSATATVQFGSTAGATSTNAPNFTVTSGASTLTLTTGSSFGAFTLTGSTCTVTGSSTFYGNVTLASGGTYTAFNPTIAGTSTFSGLGNPIGSFLVNTAGITVTLGSALTSNGDIDISAGTFDTSTNNYAVNAPRFEAQTAGIKVINLNGSTITVTETIFPWWMNGTNITINAGTSTINLTAVSGDFYGGGKTYNNVAFLTTTGTNSIVGVNTFNNLTFATATDATAGAYFEPSGTTTITGTLTLNAGTTGVARRVVKANGPGGATISVATLASMADVDFEDITVVGAAAPLTGTRIGNHLGNSGITFTAARTVYWVLPAGGNWNAAAWSTTSGNTGGTTTAVPLAQDSVVIDNAGLTAGNTITLVDGLVLPNLSFATRSTAATLDFGFVIASAYGNFILSSSVTVASSGTGLLFYHRASTITLTTAGVTIPSSLYLAIEAGGTVQLGSALVTDNGIALYDGGLVLNGFNITLNYIQIYGGAVQTVAFGTNSITVTGSGTGSLSPWYVPALNNFSYTGTPQVNIAGDGEIQHGNSSGGSEATAVSFTRIGPGTGAVNFGASHIKNLVFSSTATWTISGATKTIYGNLTLVASTTLGAGAANAVLTFAGTGTQLITMAGKTYDGPMNFSGVGGTYIFQDALTLGSTRALTFSNGTLRLKDGATSTVGSFATTGTTLKFLQSTAFGTQATISDASGTNTVTYLSLQDSNATGGATFIATSPTNVNSGNNTGWSIVGPQSGASMFFMFN